jgi:hypothetical protein
MSKSHGRSGFAALLSDGPALIHRVESPGDGNKSTKARVGPTGGTGGTGEDVAPETRELVREFGRGADEEDVCGPQQSHPGQVGGVRGCVQGCWGQMEGADPLPGPDAFPPVSAGGATPGSPSGSRASGLDGVVRALQEGTRMEYFDARRPEKARGLPGWGRWRKGRQGGRPGPGGQAAAWEVALPARLRGREGGE